MSLELHDARVNHRLKEVEGVARVRVFLMHRAKGTTGKSEHTNVLLVTSLCYMCYGITWSATITRIRAVV